MGFKRPMVRWYISFTGMTEYGRVYHGTFTEPMRMDATELNYCIDKAAEAMRVRRETVTVLNIFALAD